MEKKEVTSPASTVPSAKTPTGPVAASPAAKAPTGKTSTAPIALPQVEMPKAPTQAMPIVSMTSQPPVQLPVAAPMQTMEVHEMKKFCKEHMHRYVLVHTKDGWCVDGFVEHIDDEVICLAVPHTSAGIDPRAFLPYPPGYPYPPLYPYPYYPRRRFFRQIFPLTALLGLSLLPYY